MGAASQGTPLARFGDDSNRIFAVVSRFHFIQKGTQMKNRTTWIVAALLALSGGAFAQGGGNGNGGGAAGGGGNGARYELIRSDDGRVGHACVVEGAAQEVDFAQEAGHGYDQHAGRGRQQRYEGAVI
ncbi:hypothetical protein PTKU64_57150 [Paraburkholderia terrae]|uniref:Uncharacterized protein n=1 Tax=Paraburkholderia terrae TaxID=311230 RepID=A0ABM7TSC8_9BURK|nr:hypothetical protein PTKU64_57150 [Paraburkholderia terrae]